MPDQIFEHPRLVEIYDIFDGSRHDLDHYCDIVAEFSAKSVLDIGSGTGCFTCRLAALGHLVIGLEPSQVSLDFARSKPHADRVHWVLGDVLSLNSPPVDMAFMTGNVAQVFLSDTEWADSLRAIHRTLRPDGHLVFEVRDPAKEAWRNWTKDKTHQIHDIPKIGIVEGWCELQRVCGELVTFVWSYLFHSDAALITSESTLRFRDREAIVRSLNVAGFSIQDIRDAPDRPAQEFVFIARRSG